MPEEKNGKTRLTKKVTPGQRVHLSCLKESYGLNISYRFSIFSYGNGLICKSIGSGVISEAAAEGLAVTWAVLYNVGSSFCTSKWE